MNKMQESPTELYEKVRGGGGGGIVSSIVLSILIFELHKLLVKHNGHPLKVDMKFHLDTLTEACSI